MTPGATRLLSGATRTIAIAIAVLGAVDPALTLTRPVRPAVALVESQPGAPGSAGLADRVARAIDDDWVVVRGPLAGAAAVIAVGDRLPAVEVPTGTPAIAVLPVSAATSLAIERIDVPSRASLDARVPVSAAIRVIGAHGRRVETTLVANGLAVDTGSHDVTTETERFIAPLGFIPVGVGPATLRVIARLATPVAVEARADALVDVQPRTWRVLFFDRRPSWASTFVRRALEDDRRFDVTSRIETSRAISTATGGAPATLSDPRALSSFEAIVAGAPDALTAGDAAALERFARERGGAVILLMEKRAAGPADRLVDVEAWREETRTGPASLDAGAGLARIDASEFAWPARLPAGASAIATTGVGPDAHPVIWRAPLGAGTVVVSGALDAWRFRAAAGPDFNRFWRGVVAAAADASPPTLDVAIDSPLLMPGQVTRVRVTLRESSAALSELSATLSDNSVVHLWPDAQPDSFAGNLRAPSAPGTYHLQVVAGALTAEQPVVVLADVAVVQPDERALAAAWAAAHGGASVEASDMTSLAGALDRAIRRDRIPQAVRPMRSPWWITPFIFALGIEWGIRRRRGQY